MKRSVGLVLTLSLLFFFSTNSVEAFDKDQFITVVNPVRISSYTKSPKDSLISEYKTISQYKIPATWLLTYDTIENKEIYSIVSTMSKDQELGIFLEVTPAFAKEANVSYHDSGFWHHANSVFLSGYTQEERVKLIDAVFGKFKQNFGYYPTSVGSWWTDYYICPIPFKMFKKH